MELEGRKVTILKAIIRSYMETGEPVGSRTLSKLPDLSISSATIRNEMSDLEEMGYIVQPHTSAGRIPTDKAYRFYVDEIMKEKDTEVAEFKDLVLERVDKLEAMLRNLAKVLANNTHYATMISGPSTGRNKIKFIQLSRMDENSLLVANVLEGNLINNKIISTTDELSEQDVMNLNMLLNTSLTGLTMNEINLATIAKLKNDAGQFSDVVDKVLNEIAEIFNGEEEELQVYTSGATNIFKYPELAGGDSASRIIDQLERKDELREMFAEMNEGDENDGFHVYIGEELPIEDMTDCSMVTANYDFGQGVRGTIGIVGPKRMDYDRVLGALKSIMNQIEEKYKRGNSG